MMAVQNSTAIIQWDIIQITQKFLSIYRVYQIWCIQGIKLFYGVLHLLELFDS